MKIESFEELDVWKLGREIKIELFAIVKAFPKVEEYRLKDQHISMIKKRKETGKEVNG